MIRGLRWAAGIVFVAGLVGFVIEGANRPADPYLSSTAVVPSTVPPFGQIALRLDPAPRKAGAGPAGAGLGGVCVLLADTAGQRRHPLSVDPGPMGYAGLLLAWPSPVSVPPAPPGPALPSVAWFDGAGHWVGGASFTPCESLGSCPVQSGRGPDRPWRFALETPAGEMALLGAGPGSTLVVGGSCTTSTAAGG